MSEQSEYAVIRKRVEKRYEERTGLIIHSVAYVMVNLLLWFIAFVTGSVWEFPWPVIVMFSWGIGLFAHAMAYYQRYGGGSRKREEEIRREVELEMERLGYEKPKRDRLRLTDDGEIEPVDSYEDEEDIRTVRVPRR